jgi:hypothetical protein
LNGGKSVLPIALRNVYRYKADACRERHGSATQKADAQAEGENEPRFGEELRSVSLQMQRAEDLRRIEN